MLYNVGSHKVLHDVFVFMLVRKLILTDGFIIENNSLIMYSILYCTYKSQIPLTHWSLYMTNEKTYSRQMVLYM